MQTFNHGHPIPGRCYRNIVCYASIWTMYPSLCAVPFGWGWHTVWVTLEPQHLLCWGSKHMLMVCIRHAEVYQRQHVLSRALLACLTPQVFCGYLHASETRLPLPVCRGPFHSTPEQDMSVEPTTASACMPQVVCTRACFWVHISHGSVVTCTFIFSFSGAAGRGHHSVADYTHVSGPDVGVAGGRMDHIVLAAVC